MNNEIIEQAKIIARYDTEEKYEESQQLLLEYLKSNLYDTDAWLLVATIECNPPLEDPIRIIHCAGHILAYDPINAYALLFLVFGYRLLGRDDSEIVYTSLCQAEHSDPEVMAMIEVAKATYFQYTNLVEYEKVLKRSITYSANQQENLTMLGMLYLEQGKTVEGKDLIRKAIQNVKTVGGEDDPTDMNCLFDYYFKGTRLTQWRYDELKMMSK